MGGAVLWVYILHNFLPEFPIVKAELGQKIVLLAKCNGKLNTLNILHCQIPHKCTIPAT